MQTITSEVLGVLDAYIQEFHPQLTESLLYQAELRKRFSNKD